MGSDVTTPKRQFGTNFLFNGIRKAIFLYLIKSCLKVSFVKNILRMYVL